MDDVYLKQIRMVGEKNATQMFIETKQERINNAEKILKKIEYIKEKL